jgi:protein XagA
MARGSRAGSRIGFVLGIGLAAAPGEAFAGAWTLDAGTGQVDVIGLASTSYLGFDGSRDLVSIPRYNKFEIDGLFEYGATDWLTLMVLPQFQHVDVGAPIDAQRTGLGYTEFGGRAKVYDGNGWVFSVQTTLRLPGTSQAGNPAAIGYTDVQTDVRGLAGHGFTLGPWPAYFNLEVAQRFRSEGAPDEFHADLTFGVQPAPRWTLLAQSFNVVSEGAGTWGFPSYDYYKLQLSAVYALTPKTSLQFGGFTTYTGRNALQENGVIFGAWYRF